MSFKYEPASEPLHISGESTRAADAMGVVLDVLGAVVVDDCTRGDTTVR